MDDLNATPPRTHPADLWLEVGRVTKPHGRRGWLVYRPHSGRLDVPVEGQIVRVTQADGITIDETVDALRPFKQGGLIRFAGQEGPEEAERFRGATILVQRGDLPPLAADEVYLTDLLGLEARLPGGERAGTVQDAIDTGPVLTLYIDGPHGGTVPYHRDWIEEPDFDAGVLPLRRGPIR